MCDGFTGGGGDLAESVISKIKKAIRLANRTTSEGERETALRLARSLAERNGLALEDIEVSQSEVKAVQVDDADDVHFIRGSEIGFAGFILSEHFGVVMMVTASRNGRGHYSWFGPRINIEIARHVNHILLRESRRAYRRTQRELAEAGVPSLDRRSFMQGFFAAIHAKLAAHPLRNDHEQFAAEKRAAERKFEEFRARNVVRDSRRTKQGSDGSAAAVGFAAGDSVNLARPCGCAAAGRLSIGVR